MAQSRQCKPSQWHPRARSFDIAIAAWRGLLEFYVNISSALLQGIYVRSAAGSQFWRLTADDVFHKNESRTRANALLYNLWNRVSTAASVGRIHKFKTKYFEVSCTHSKKYHGIFVYVEQTSPTYISCRLESWTSIIQSVELTADVLTTHLGKTLKNVWEK